MLTTPNLSRLYTCTVPVTPRRKSTPHMETTPRHSSRLRKETKLPDQQTPQEHSTSNQQSCSNNSTSNFSKLSSEVRQLIFSYLIVRERPFFIGRCQEDRRKTLGSPRDAVPNHRYITKWKPRRNERRNRPIQPPITRVCRSFREEALQLWYSKNSFWLIHNEYESRNEGELEDEVPNLERRFDAWISQTRRDMFDFMEHISLCGYSDWPPDRMMISIDLKNRRIVDIEHYSTYGDELPISQEFIDSTKKALASKADADGFTALKAVLAERDSLFRIPRRLNVSGPRTERRELACGWEFDW